ncbi:uncharacterized protein LOC135707030 [Ochlerotatus camptorhynchus]|uniref:uncharacterized protein LOC135707030 n=1 Tax=Ochlerotatus camptorhynchus TaxID=644619 RepID=UPI0031D8F9AB
MNSLTTVFLLLAGLIATCTARILVVDNSYVRVSYPSSSSSEESMDFVHDLEIGCYKKTGSDQAFEDMAASFAAFPLCFSMHVDMDNFANDLDRLNASTRHEIFPKYCPQVRNALSCFDLPLKQLSKCLNDDDALILLATHNAVHEALHLICENDGEILFLEGATYNVCMENYSDYTVECSNVISDPELTMGISKYGEAQCIELSQIRDCMQNKFNECNGPRLIDVFDVFWRALLNNSPCRNFIIGPNEVEDDRTHYEIV